MSAVAVPTARLAAPPKGRAALLDVALARSCVPQGDSLDGLVLVRVLDAVEVGDLTVTVECTAKTSITRKPLTVFSHATSRTAYIDALPRQRFVTPAIRGVVLNPGEYQFPFSLELPADAPPSMHIDQQLVLASISYTVTAKITRPLTASRTNFSSTIHRSQFWVLAAPPSSASTNLIARNPHVDQYLPFQAPVPCGCWPTSSRPAPRSPASQLALHAFRDASQDDQPEGTQPPHLEFKATLETTALHLGESCSINIWIRNVSDLVVETVAVGIEETLTAKAIDYSSTIKVRTLALPSCKAVSLGQGDESASTFKVAVDVTAGSFHSASISLSHAILFQVHVQGLRKAFCIRLENVHVYQSVNKMPEGAVKGSDVDELADYRPEEARILHGAMVLSTQTVPEARAVS